MNKVKTLSKNLKNFFLNPRFIVSFFILLISTVINATYVHAENDDNILDFYDSNNIFYYDGKASSGGCNSPLDLSNNTLYNGEPVIDQASLKKIEENKPVYEEYANKYGFEWQIIAAIHGMEFSYRTDKNPNNGQGVYQFLEQAGKFPPNKKLTWDDFKEQTNEVARQIKEVYGKNMDLSSEDGIKRMMYSYNSGPGGSSLYNRNARDWLHYTDEQIKNGEGSPYVMNLADEQRDSRHNEHWQEFHCDYNCVGRATVRPGAFLIYKALGGRGSASGNNCIGGATGNLIVDTALKLAWPQNELSRAKHFELVPEYKSAMEQFNLTGKFSPPGASCDVFVSAVMALSGIDPEFPKHCCGVSNNGDTYTYVHGSPLYERLPYDDNFLRNKANYNDPNLQNGDILLKTSGNGNGESYGHIAIFYRDSSNVPHMIHASKGDRTGAVTGVYGAPFEIWRYVGDKPINTNTTIENNTNKNTDKNANKASNNTENIPVSQ